MISLLNKKIDFFSKDNLILLLFSLSIFFSHLKFFSIEFRFIYLVTFFLLIWDYFFVKKISNKIIFISFLISAIIFFHSIKIIRIIFIFIPKLNLMNFSQL